MADWFDQLFVLDFQDLLSRGCFDFRLKYLFTTILFSSRETRMTVDKKIHRRFSSQKAVDLNAYLRLYIHRCASKGESRDMFHHYGSSDL